MTNYMTSTDDITVIAEMANAHEGELTKAKDIVSSVSESADAVKFQVFTADELVLPSHPNYEEFSNLSMSEEEWGKLVEYAYDSEVGVFADVFGPRSVDLMVDQGVNSFKIHNADVSNASLVEYVANHAEAVLLSSGGSTWVELADALELLAGVPTVLMYGYQNYPTSVEDANLRRIQALQEKFDTPIGYASHAPGESDVAVELPKLATAAGAVAVEVHITTDRSEKGTDYYSSLEPDEFEEMAEAATSAEPLLGEKTLELPKSEYEYREQHKKWLVATDTVEEEGILTSDNIGYKRIDDPGIDTNLKEEDVVGRRVTKRLSTGDPITLKHMDAKVVATLACRSESTRLYGKPLQQIGDEPILTHLVDQLRKVEAIDDIVLAIADAPSRDSYREYARSKGIGYVVGSEENVLGRLIEAGKEGNADVAVRVTTENPFVYTQNVDQMVEEHLKRNHDYSMTEELPLGSSIEVASITALETANRRGSERHRSELCTLFLVENPSSFSINLHTPPEDMRRPDLRLTVDNPEDLVVARRIWEHLPENTRTPSLRSVVECVDENPGITELNDNLPDGTDEDVRKVRPFMYGEKEVTE